MVLGDHGRKILYPMTISQQFAHFPWKKVYQNSMYFRAFCATGLAFGLGWTYIILKGNLKPLFKFLIFSIHGKKIYFKLGN